MRLLSLFLLALSAQAQPTVSKVEPPNWWVKTTLNPVRVLIHGANLTGASVSSDLKTSRVQVSASGTYLFADVRIPPNARSGAYPLTITTADGSASAPFELLEPLAKPGRFAGFSPDDVIYLLMPDRFANGDPSNDNPAISPGLFDKSNPHYYHGGDFKGIRDHLAYFKDLGVTALWLNPWYDNVNTLNTKQPADGQPITDYHGYGAVDMYGVEEHFGTLRELQELVDAAHGQGIKIIQDEVANHVGPDHPWTLDSPTPTWLHGTVANHQNETWQLWPLIDPYAAPALKAQTLDGWFADVLPDLNQDDPECARYLTQNTLWWIGITGMDAVRMDTLPYVPQSFWKQWTAAIRLEYPAVNIVGEAFSEDPAIPAFFQDSPLTVFDFPSYFKVRDSIARGRSIRELSEMLAHDRLYPAPDDLVNFIDNHDVIRFMNEPGVSIDRLKLAFTWLMTTRGIPLIYYGDEIAMPGGADPDNRRDFPESAFLQSTRTDDQQSVFAHLQALIALRAATPALRHGKTRSLCATDQQWVYARVTQDQVAVIEINNADEPAAIACSVPSSLKTVWGDGPAGDPIPPHSARIAIGQHPEGVIW